MVRKTDEFIDSFSTSMSLLNETGDAIDPDFIEHKLEELLLYIAQKYGPKALSIYKSSTSRKLDAERRLRNIVEKHVYARLSLEELAFLCHMSLSTFKREFQRIFKTSPSRWIQKNAWSARVNYWFGKKNARVIFTLKWDMKVYPVLPNRSNRNTASRPNNFNWTKIELLATFFELLK